MKIRESFTFLENRLSPAMMSKQAGYVITMMADAMSYNKPLKRLLGWMAVFDHPNEFGCYPNCMLGEFETTPCFNRVNIGLNLNHLTASAVSKEGMQ